ncbi:uncharacterized protein DDB_G0271670-like [Neocloeon triangulifer]|uniref:uncharacterized protein DDB_G0271670-like n=1 Tax=Neocloeon triangulifer TaxID=2078957 RepID=UPI00286F5461|nr:uncharacterized protein DDB_G0271670-like [Neocloeon triangulifer]
MGKYSSESDSSDSGRGGRKSKTVKSSSSRSHRTKGRSPSTSPGNPSRHKSESYSSRHKKKCKSRRSRSRDRYGSSSSKSRRGGKYSRRSSSSSSTDSRTKSSKRSPSVSSSSTTNSNAAPSVRDLAGVISAGSNDLLSSAEQLRLKVQKAIQAASDLKQRKAEEQMLLAPPVISQSSIDEINADGFAPKSFLSAPRNIPDIPLPTVVDLTAEPKKEDSGIVSSVLLDDEPAREERWARKLLAIRQQTRLGSSGKNLGVQA